MDPKHEQLRTLGRRELFQSVGTGIGSAAGDPIYLVEADVNGDGAISVTDRVALIKRVRRLAVACAKAYVVRREELGYPLMDSGGQVAVAEERQ